MGLLNSIEDIENIIIENLNGVPLLVKHVAKVVETDLPRVGQVGYNEIDDVVEGIIVMRKGENPSEVLKRVKEKIAELDEMDTQLKQYQGINYNYSQPIIDNVTEAVAGMNANNAVKNFWE